MNEVDESPAIRELSPGRLLLQGRKDAGLTQEQIAKELYMTVAKVRALESDDFGSLNSETFARGYIRSYANLVKIDVVSVLDAYERCVLRKRNDEDTVQITPSVVKAQSASTHKVAWQFLVFVGLFFVGLWLISVWFFDNHQDGKYVQSASTLPGTSRSFSSSTEPLLLNSSSADAVVLSSSIEASSNAMVSSVPAVRLIAVASSVAVSSSRSATINSSQQKSSVVSSLLSSHAEQSSVDTKWKEASSPVSDMNLTYAKNQITVFAKGEASSRDKNALDEIAFSFSAECWLEVSDSRGDVLATELQSARSQLKLVGKAPFEVKLGNAPAVTMSLNGRKVDVIPLLGSNVLMLKVSN